MLSLVRIALAVVVLASIGCDARADRVYDDTLRLTAYVGPRPGEVVLEWTGGPSGYQRWEYSTLGWPDWPDPVWRDVPEHAGMGRQMRLSLTPDKWYEFKIRERGDERDPAETNPGAVVEIVTPSVADDGSTRFWDRPLEPGARFWFGYHGVHVTAPPEGKLLVRWYAECVEALVGLSVTLDTDGREVRAYTELWVMPPHLDREKWAVLVETPGLLDSYELPAYPHGLTAREQAEQAGTPEKRAAYRLLADAIESMFNGYPPTAPESLERALSRIC